MGVVRVRVVRVRVVRVRVVRVRVVRVRVVRVRVVRVRVVRVRVERVTHTHPQCKTVISRSLQHLLEVGATIEVAVTEVAEEL